MRAFAHDDIVGELVPAADHSSRASIIDCVLSTTATTMTAEKRVIAERELLDELRQHKGEWVAIRDAHIVATAPTRTELREQVSLGNIDAYFEVASDESVIDVF